MANFRVFWTSDPPAEVSLFGEMTLDRDDVGQNDRNTLNLGQSPKFSHFWDILAETPTLARVIKDVVLPRISVHPLTCG